MARAALNWSLSELAKQSGLGVATVSRFETDASKITRANLETLRRTFEAAGIEFVEGGAALKDTAKEGQRGG
jgi:transcriptional regulator with XRE-family HTH domain